MQNICFSLIIHLLSPVIVIKMTSNSDRWCDASHLSNVKSHLLGVSSPSRVGLDRSVHRRFDKPSGSVAQDWIARKANDIERLPWELKLIFQEPTMHHQISVQLYEVLCNTALNIVCAHDGVTGLEVGRTSLFQNRKPVT